MGVDAFCGNRKQIEHRSVEALVPYASNSRTHSDAQIAQIAASIQEFGWTNPLLIDEVGGIIAGHGRLLAAKLIGADEVPCLVLEGLSEAQKRALVLADNKLAMNAGWDMDLLASELAALGDGGFDLSLIGFSDDELSGLLADKTVGLTDPDAVPDAPVEPVTVPGDVWLLGKHRLVCGDSTDADTVAKCTNGERADCVFTSPPYGVGLDYGDTYEDTLDNLRAMLPILADSWLNAVERGGFAVVNFGDIVAGRAASDSDEPCEYPMAIEYWPPFRARGWYLWSRRVWCKPNARVHSPWAIQSNRASSDWENVWTWKAPGKAIVQRINGQYQSANGWVDTSKDHGVDVGKAVHGAGMAVALPCRMISIHSRDGRVVFEPFTGTGTTMIASEMVGRRCFGIELSPAYVDVAVIRWQEFTGKQAVHEDGRLFDDLREPVKEAA